MEARGGGRGGGGVEGFDEAVAELAAAEVAAAAPPHAGVAPHAPGVTPPPPPPPTPAAGCGGEALVRTNCMIGMLEGSCGLSAVACSEASLPPSGGEPSLGPGVR